MTRASNFTTLVLLLVVGTVVAQFPTTVTLVVSTTSTTRVLDLSSYATDFTTAVTASGNSSLVYSAYVTLYGAGFSGTDTLTLDATILKSKIAGLTITSGAYTAFNDSNTLPVSWSSVQGSHMVLQGPVAAVVMADYLSSVYVDLSSSTSSLLAQSSTDLAADFKICWSLDFYPNCNSETEGFTAGVVSDQANLVPSTLAPSVAVAGYCSGSLATTSATTHSRLTATQLDPFTINGNSLATDGPLASLGSANRKTWFGATASISGLTFTPSLGTFQATALRLENGTDGNTTLTTFYCGDADGTLATAEAGPYNATASGVTIPFFVANHSQTLPVICKVTTSPLTLCGKVLLSRTAPTTTTAAPVTTSTPQPTPTTAAPTTAPATPAPTTATPVPTPAPATTTSAPTNASSGSSASGSHQSTVAASSGPMQQFTVELGSVMESEIFDPDVYTIARASLVIKAINATWSATPDISFISSVSVLDDPLGFQSYISDSPPTFTTDGASRLNITFEASKCFMFKKENAVYISVGNGSLLLPPNAPAGSVLPFIDNTVDLSHVVANQHVPSVTFVPDLGTSTRTSGVVLVVLIGAATAGLVILEWWAHAVTTLLQLQGLIALGFSSCSPPGVRGVVEAASWGMWPFSERSSTGSSISSAQQHHGRLVLNLSITFGFLLFHILAVMLFICFGSHRNIPAATARTRFVNASLFVFLALFTGSAYSSVFTIAQHSHGQLFGNVANALGTAVLSLLIQILVIALSTVVLFKMVSRQVYKRATTRGIWYRTVLGGSWMDQDALKRFGVLYQDVNGSSFWYFAAYLMLCFLGASFAAFLPSTKTGCTSQYYVVLAVNTISTLTMVTRQPFKSPVLNALNLVVSFIMMLTVVGYATAMTCSRRGAKFAQAGAFLTLAAIWLKATLGVGMAIGERFVAHKDKEQEELEDFIVTSEPKRRGIKDDDVYVFPLKDAVDNIGGNGTLSTVAYRPAIPVPVMVGPSIVCREMGFGPKGGLVGTSGPSVALQLNEPSGLVATADTVYLVDGKNNRVLAHNVRSRRLTTLVDANTLGVESDSHSFIGGSEAASSGLSEPTGCALGQHSIYVADTGNHLIRRIDTGSRQLHTVQGRDSHGAVFHLKKPMGIASEGDFLYVADSQNHRIVQAHLPSSVWRSVAGTGYRGFDGTGNSAAAARLNNPQAVTVDTCTRTLYIADTGNHRVVCVRPSGVLEVILGKSGVAGESDGSRGTTIGTNVAICLPTDVAALPDSSIVVVDGGNCKLWRVSRLGYAQVILPPNDHCVPRRLCRAIHPSSATGNDETQENDLQMSSMYSPVGGSSGKFAVKGRPDSRSNQDTYLQEGKAGLGSPLLGAIPALNNTDPSMGLATLYVADSQNHVVCHVEVQSSGGASTFGINAMRETSEVHTSQRFERIVESYQVGNTSRRTAVVEGEDTDDVPARKQNPIGRYNY